MGSCTTKNKRRPNFDKSNEITEYASSRRKQEKAKIHLAVESRRIIFLHKDANAPILEIKSNPLYMNRKKINLEKICPDNN